MLATTPNETSHEKAPLLLRENLAFFNFEVAKKVGKDRK
jgi:hypothetical protein